MAKMSNETKLKRYDALAEVVEELHDENMELRKQLQRIADWDELTIEYKVNFGFCGQMEYYRKIAKDALKVGADTTANVAPNAEITGRASGPG